MMETLSAACTDGADKAMVATSAVVAAESSRIRVSDMASSLCSFTAPLSLPSLLHDNMGAPNNKLWHQPFIQLSRKS
jgi:hypothetical protein